MLRLEPGDELQKSLEEACTAQQIQMGTISGFGSLNRLEIGAYSSEKQALTTLLYQQDLEIVSLCGSVTPNAGGVNVHCHLAVADTGGNVVGGHLLRGTTGRGARLWVQVLGGSVARTFGGTKIYDATMP